MYDLSERKVKSRQFSCTLYLWHNLFLRKSFMSLASSSGIHWLVLFILLFAPQMWTNQKSVQNYFFGNGRVNERMKKPLKFPHNHLVDIIFYDAVAIECSIHELKRILNRVFFRERKRKNRTKCVTNSYNASWFIGWVHISMTKSSKFAKYGRLVNSCCVCVNMRFIAAEIQLII